MPTLPGQIGPTVAPTGANGTFLRDSSTPDAFGAGVARATAMLGAAVGDASQSVFRFEQAQQGLMNEASAKEADVQATKRLSVLQFGMPGDNGADAAEGYYSRSGKNAVSTYKESVEAAEQIRRDILDNMPNPAARKLADGAITHRTMSAIEGMTRHAATENRKWQLQTSDARAQAAWEGAALAYNDDRQFKLALGTARSEAISQGELQGWDKDTTNMRIRQYSDAAWKQRLDVWRLQDPVGALDALQKSGDQISPVLKLQLSHQLYTAAAPVLAAQWNALGGAGVTDQAAGKTVVATSMPRGIRNNNPGNIVQGDTKWQGEIAGTDPRYASFETPEAGVRAIGKTLITYGDVHGLNTVESIIGRWAPASENNTQAYVNNVAAQLGVKPADPIDLKNPATLAQLTKAIISHENGKAGEGLISDKQITAGLDSALNGTKLPITASAVTPAKNPAKDPDAITGIGVIDALPPDWKMHVIQLAQAQAKENMAGQREALGQQVKDAEASYIANGVSSTRPADADLIKVFGQVHGVALARRLGEAQTLGSNIQQIKSMPDADITTLLKTAKPVEGDGYAQRLADYQHLQTAAQHVREARAADPGGYAVATNSYGWKPINDMADPNAIAAELSNRTASVARMSKDYGVAPTVLTKPEAKAIAVGLRSAPIDAQKQYLAALYKGTDGDMQLFKSTMQSIAPDAPVVSVAGIYQAKAYQTTATKDRAATDVSDLILRGNAILNPPKAADGSDHQGGKALIKMPEEKLMLSDWASVTGDAFKGKEQASDLFQQTAKAIYAARSAEEGDYTGVYNSRRWKASIQLATGGIESYNGGQIVMPYGMEIDKFRDAMATKIKDLAGPELSPSEMAALPVENVGDGRYVFRRGSGYLVDKSGRPMVADLNAGVKAPAQPPADPTAVVKPAAYPSFGVTGGGAVTGLPRKGK